MAIDGKYGQVEIDGIDYYEPVFIIRAKDVVLPAILLDYVKRCKELGADDTHTSSVLSARDDIIEWQRDHSHIVRVPDTNDRQYDPGPVWDDGQSPFRGDVRT